MLKSRATRLSHRSRPGSYIVVADGVLLQRPTRQMSQLVTMPSASSFGLPRPCGHFVNSTKRAQKLTAPSATSHGLSMALGTTLLCSLVRPGVMAQFERRGCLILHTLAPSFIVFLKKTAKLRERLDFSGLNFFSFFFPK